MDNIILEQLSNGICNLREKKEIESEKQIRYLLHNLSWLQQFNAKSQRANIRKILQRSKPKCTEITHTPGLKKKITTDPEIKQLIQRRKRKYQWMLSSKHDLVLTEPGTFIGKLKNRVVVRMEGEVIEQVPFKQLQHIVVLTRGITLSSNLIEACAYYKIPIDFINYTGKAHARMFCPDNPIYNFGLNQVSAFQNEKFVVLSKGFVEGKIKNQLNTILYFSKYRAKKDKNSRKN